jgi:hypothetical protein
MPCITHDNTSSILNTKGTAPTGRTKPTDAARAGPYFINIIYTKLPACPSREILAIIGFSREHLNAI